MGLSCSFFYFARRHGPNWLIIYRVLGKYDIYLPSNFRVDRASDGCWSAPIHDACHRPVFWWFLGYLLLFDFARRHSPNWLRVYRVLVEYDIYLPSNFRVNRARMGAGAWRKTKQKSIANDKKKLISGRTAPGYMSVLIRRSATKLRVSNYWTVSQCHLSNLNN